MMLLGRCRSDERCRYRQNWLVIKACCTLIGAAYFISLPSLHQFVTSSAHPEDENIQPGLGLSETWYSWIVSVQSIGELAGAIVVGILLRWLYTKHLILSALALSACGGLLFGVGKYSWMLLIGRCLIGVFQGAMMAILRTYIGETSTTLIASMPPEKREKSTLKYTTFIITFSVCTVSVLVGSGIAAVVAQFPSIDQFRWPGYFILLQAVVLGVATLFGFREKKQDLQRAGGSIKFRGFPVPFYTLACLIGAFFVINWYFAVVETLLNPVLGDNFGFDVLFNSYAFVGTLLFFTSGAFVLYIFQWLHIDNRTICLLGLLIAFSGSLIASDWQSLRGDPCDQFSEARFNSELLDISNNVSGSSGSAPADSADDVISLQCDVEPGGYRCTAVKHGIDLEQCEDADYRMNASCVCEAFSGTPYHCFWNPQSRVTGKQCPRCAKLCRSHEKSLYFAQFMVGITLISTTIPLGRITLTLIASDAMAGESQALIMGVLVGVGSLARFTGPLWGNVAYLAANHHIYIVMNILTASMLLVIVPFILFYRTMRPIQQQTELRTSDNVAIMEMSVASNDVNEQGTVDTDLVQLKHFVSGTAPRQRTSSTEVSRRGKDRGGGEEGSGGDRGGRGKVGCSGKGNGEQVLLLSAMEMGVEDDEEDGLDDLQS